MKLSIFSLLVLCCVSACSPVLAEKPTTSQSLDFELPNHRGQNWSLADAPAGKPVVVAFLGTECPLVKLYTPRLEELKSEFEGKATFVGVNSNTQDSMTEMTAFVSKYKVTFPMLKDVGNEVADQLGAKRTPEVVVLDKDRVVRYRGRIDDQYGIGYAREEPKRRDLAVALEELLAGKQVSTPETESYGCFIGRVTKTSPTGDITYTKQISRILNNRCVGCHRTGEVAPFTLTSYEDIIGWEDTILEVIDENRMPPWNANPKHGDFANDARLSDEEKKLIHDWIRNGMPEGDAADLPGPPEFVEGWRIPQPDQIFYMDDDAFEIPAEGVVDYQYFSVDPKWDEDKYIVAAEARPGNRSIVHHIIVYVIAPGESARRSENRHMVVGYAPGSNAQILEDGVAIKVPAGGKLLFEVHYTPNGRPHTDRSYVGFKFTEQKNVKKQLRGRMAINTRFRIPPGAAAHEVTANYRSARDELLLSMTPHMHLRGKSFRYEAIYPDKSREILLDVPKYDFNWQLSYELAEPKFIPRGTQIVCTAQFDNSEDNPVNPNPEKTVRWGDQSWEEMMIGFFDVVSPDAVAKPLESKASVDPTGVWTWKRGRNEDRLTLKLVDNKLTGTILSEGKTRTIERAIISADKIEFQLSVPELGELTFDFDAKVTRNEMKGNVKVTVGSVGRSQTLPWNAKREE